MASAELNGATIHDWDSFHVESQRTFGFPAFYGRNANAWVDCLTYLDEGDGLSRFTLGVDEPLEIEVHETAAWEAAAPEVLAGFVGLTAVVNRRYLEAGKSAVLRVSFQ